MNVSSAPALRRVGTRAAAGAATAALVVLVTPAAASAAVATTTPATSSAPASSTTSSGTVTPLLDCYTQNSDGSYTAVLGYASTWSTTQSIPLGSRNSFTPTTYNGAQPTSFQAGTHHGAFSLKVSASDVATGVTWALDGHTLDYAAAAYASGVCTPGTSLPAEGNGTGWTIGLVAAGLVGGAAVWRGRSRSARAAAPGGQA